MPQLLVATTNPNKLREIRDLLSAANVVLSCLADLPPVVEPDETGSSFEENARLKARFYDDHARRVRASGQDPVLTVAEDSGLVIDALDGEPGIYSARFVSPHATYAERFAEIYRRLQIGQAPQPWTARFVCALSVVVNGQPVFETRGVVEGLIAPEPAGVYGFGYDPIFLFPAYGKTFGQASDREKLAVAHRGHAFRALDRWLSEPHPY